MAPSRGKDKSRPSNPTSQPPRRTRNSTPKRKNFVPKVYQDLLAEDAATESTEGDADRPLKKRRIALNASAAVSRAVQSDHQQANDAQSTIVQQTVEDFSQSEDEDDSDIDFEDVDLDLSLAHAPVKQDDGITNISVTIDPATAPKRSAVVKRKPVSAAERAFRRLIHQAHVLCLLGHCIYVNGRCNNDEVHHHLRTRLSKKTVSYLNPSTNDSQFQRNRLFMEGLQQALEAFETSFEITESGMQRAKWPLDPDEEVDIELDDMKPVDRSYFIAAAKNMEGSQDTANQLFCALLRSVGVEARLICSLQPLPFGNQSVKSTRVEKVVKPTVFAMARSPQTAKNDSENEDKAVQHSSSIGKVPAARRRLGQPAFAPENSIAPIPKKKKAVRKLAYPVFWVEAFNEAQQKWIAIDPIVTRTIGKPSKFEPPSSDDSNQMSYVIAFESDGVAKDVTRRYAKAYNAKTRRNRVESTENGAQWLRKALRIFRRRGGALDREQVEDAELAQREAREGLPSNVQDFKDHPHYALERHLRRNEVVHPKREVGKVNTGTAAKPRMEVVYRRADVCVCRSADKWFRLGREVKKGEVAVKRVSARRPRHTTNDEENGEEEDTTVASYALFQTELYVPPPIVKGKIPKNAYGNLDVYVPSMVPAGGSHIRHQLAQQAARILKIDYADAVTGFNFKGRHGTAVTEGVVVAEQYADAVRAVIEGMEDEQVEEESKARSALALRTWRRFLTGLRIAERVSGYGDANVENDLRMELDAAEDEQDIVAEAGGFFPTDTATDFALPTAGRFSLDELSISTKKQKASTRRQPETESEEADFSSEAASELSEPTNRVPQSRRRAVALSSEDESMPDAATTESGGGFLLDDTPETANGVGGGFISGPEQLEHDGFRNSGGFIPDDPDTAIENDYGGNVPAVTNGVHEEQAFDDALVLASGKKPSIDPLSAPESEHETPSMHTSVEAHPTRDVNETNATKTSHTSVGELDNGPSQELNGAGTFGEEAVNVEPSVHVETPLDGYTTAHAGSKDALDDALITNDEVSKNSEAESDHGSMLSHDPEDEDAEPDWLESDSD